MLVGLQLIGTMASLYLPSLNGKIIDEGVAKGDTGYIVRTGGWMLAVSLVQIVATVAATYLGAKSAAGLGRDLRAGIFARVGDFSAQEVSRFGAPTLISRNTNDVTQVQTVVFMGAAMMVSAPIMMVGGIIMALREDVGLSWLVAVAVPALALSVALVIRKMIPQFRLMQESVDWVNRVLREQITGIRVVRAFVREDHEQARFAEANTQYTGTALAVGRLMALIFPIVMLIFNASTVAVLWFGAHRVESGQMQIGELTAFMGYLMQILMSVMMATFMSMMIPRATVSAGRITEVLDTDSTVVQPTAPVAIPRTGTTVGAARRRVPLPRRRRACPARGFDDRRARQDHRDHRQHRRGQVHAGLPRSRASTTSPAASVPLGGVDVRDATSRTSGRGSAWCRRSPTCSPARSRPTCATATPTRPTRSCGRPCGSRRPRTSSRAMPAGARLADRPGRHQRLRRPAATARHRPGAGAPSPRSTCSTTASRPSTCPRTRGSGRR